MKNIFHTILKSIGATVMIGIGCLIYINQPNPLGAFFFSIGLLGVFYYNLNLFFIISATTLAFKFVLSILR